MASTASPPLETRVKTSSSAAEHFIDWYYRDLNDHKSLANYYINSSAKYAASASPAAYIVINGKHLPVPTDYDDLLKAQRGSGPQKSVRYEVDSWDAHPLNPNFIHGCPEHLAQKQDNTGGRTSVMVQVAGTIKLGSGSEAPKKAFAENFVLVPNWEVYTPPGVNGAGKGTPRNAKRWLIQSQNYRTL